MNTLPLGSWHAVAKLVSNLPETATSPASNNETWAQEAAQFPANPVQIRNPAVCCFVITVILQELAMICKNKTFQPTSRDRAVSLSQGRSLHGPYNFSRAFFLLHVLVEHHKVRPMAVGVVLTFRVPAFSARVIPSTWWDLLAFQNYQMVFLRHHETHSLLGQTQSSRQNPLFSCIAAGTGRRSPETELDPGS